MLKRNSNTLATWCEELTHWKRPWCWERLRAGGEGDVRGWDGWMASLTHGHEFESSPGAGAGQGGLACCSPWGHKESDRTERLIWTEPDPLSYNIHFKISELVRMFSGRRNCPQAGYIVDIIPSTEFKLSCCVIISSWLKEKKQLYVTKTKKCREKKNTNIYPFLLLENSRPLSPQEPQTPFSSSGTPRFLINLPRNWLSQVVICITDSICYTPEMIITV